MINPTQKKKIITAAILETITAGKGEWITGILPAVKATNVTKTMNGWTLRTCLQTLLDAGLVYRVSFTSDEVYDLTANKVAPIMPEGGWTIIDALYKGEMVDLIASASDGEKLSQSVTCPVTGITVFLKVEKGQIVSTLADGTDVSDLYSKALDAAVGA